jgi:hypothetical protein
MTRAIMRGMSAVLAAAGLAILLQAPAWAACRPLPASGAFAVTSATVDSSRVVNGNTILVVTFSGITTGTFNGPFTETDREVIHPNGRVTLTGRGVQSGTLGTCGTGSAPYVTEARGTVSTLTGSVQFIDQAKIHSVYWYVANTITGQGTYTGFYQCT